MLETAHSENSLELTECPRALVARPERRRGFTLIEVLLVVVILGMLSQAVVVSYQNWVPESQLDAAAADLTNAIVTLRSEAGIRGERVELELDLDRNRYQYIWPPEQRVTLDQDLPTERVSGWFPLEDGILISGHQIIGDRVVDDGRVRIPIDPNGFTAEQMIYLELDDPSARELVWTIQLRGLENEAVVVRDFEGNQRPLQEIEEFEFR